MKKNFSMIAGYENIKKELKEVCKVLQNTEDLKLKGLRMPKGILFEGAPGVGKTVFSEAIINESGLHCEKIDFGKLSDDEVVDYLSKKFKNAIANAPAIVFMDELDKVCGRMEFLGGLADMNISRKILNVIDQNQNDEIMLIATVNDLCMLHPAMYRSGRFDRTIKIPMPNLQDRKEIIEYYAAGKQFDKKVKFETIAKMTAGFSGADIECIMNESGLNAIINDRNFISQEDIDKAINRVVFKSCEKPNPLDIKNKESVAVHETGHLLMGLLLNEEMVGGVSILPQGESAGHVKIGMESNGTKSKDEMLNIVITALGGKAAENVFYPEREYTGSGSDIIKAVAIVKDLVSLDCCYGLEYQYKIPEDSFGSLEVSDYKLKKIEDKQTEILNECLEKAKCLISKNIDIAKTFVKKLVKNYTLTREEIITIYNKQKRNATDKKVA